MDKYINSIKIADLIAKYLKDELNDEDERYLKQWLDEDAEHVVLFNELKNKIAIAEKQSLYSTYDIEKNWERIYLRIRDQFKFRIRRYSIAAAVVLFLCGVSYLLLDQKNKDFPEMASKTIEVGMQRATLVLEDGRKIDLDTMRHMDFNSISVDNSATGLMYSQNQGDTDVASNVFHLLEVPRGGEYNLEFEDGTHVWVNAGSRLRFPVRFASDKRIVYLEGEAYFDVEKDSLRPFMVVTDDQTLEVLGTEFNVNAYPDEYSVTTTLVNGRVKVVSSRKEVAVLEPGEQARLNRQDGNLYKEKVYVEEFVSWKSGYFVFQDQTLGQIMRQLSRWYNFHVFYQNAELENIVFQGKLRKYEDFGKVLKLLEKTGGIHFQVEGRTITISD